MNPPLHSLDKIGYSPRMSSPPYGRVGYLYTKYIGNTTRQTNKWMDGEDTLDRKLCSTVALKLLLLLLPKELGKERRLLGW